MLNDISASVSSMKPVKVSELNNYIKTLLDTDINLKMICVEGEISNYVEHSSGHSFFTLKDKTASIKAVFFKGYKTTLRFRPQSGMQVLAVGDVSAFPRDGVYQLYVQHLYPSGIGDIYADFERLKEKLSAEGIFDEAHKKPLPYIPERVGIITSPTGAVIRDIMSVYGRRFVPTHIELYPATVQGSEAAIGTINGLRYFNAKGECDVIIIARGGGSAEDLFVYNDEALAKEIYASKIPVVTAIGHETDYTIADFAADRRAATPTAAAELTVPDKRELLTLLGGFEATLLHSMEAILAESCACVASAEAYINDMTAERIGSLRSALDNAAALTDSGVTAILANKARQLAAAARVTEGLSPIKTLLRGYSVVTDSAGRPITAADAVKTGDTIDIVLAHGGISATVNETKEENGYDF